MVLEEVEEVVAMVEGADIKLLPTYHGIDMNHGQVYSAATKTVKCFISTAEEGVLLQVTNEEVVNHRVFKK